MPSIVRNSSYNPLKCSKFGGQNFCFKPFSKKHSKLYNDSCSLVISFENDFAQARTNLKSISLKLLLVNIPNWITHYIVGPMVRH